MLVVILWNQYFSQNQLKNCSQRNPSFYVVDYIIRDFKEKIIFSGNKWQDGTIGFSILRIPEGKKKTKFKKI